MFDKSNKQNYNHVQRNNKSQGGTKKVYTKDNGVVTNVNLRNLQTRQNIDQLNEINFDTIKKTSFFIGGKYIKEVVDYGT